MDTDLGFILEKLGLTKAEILVFSVLVQSGSSGIGDVIKKSQLHRGTVYNTLQRLIQKGLVYTSSADGSTIYGPNSQGFLSDLADEKQRLVEKNALIKVVRERVRLAKTTNSTSKEYSTIIYGNNAAKNFFLNLLFNCRENDEKYKNFENVGVVSDAMGFQYYKSVQEKKVQLGVKCHIILNEEGRGDQEMDYILGNVKWMPLNHDFGKFGVYIYNDKVAKVNLGANPLRIEIFSDKSNLKWHSSIFKTFWKDIALKRDEYLEHNIWRQRRKN